MEDVAEFAVSVATKLGADYAEARVQSNEGSSFTLRDGIPEPVAIEKSRGIGIRVLIKGSLAFTSTNTLTRDKVEEAVKSAYRIAKASMRLIKSPVRLSVEQSHEARWKVESKIPAIDISPEEKFKVLNEIEHSIQEGAVGVSLPSRLLVLSDDLQNKVYVNSDGCRICAEIPRISFWFFITAYQPGRGTVQRWRHLAETSGWEAVKSWNLPSVVSDEARILGKILREARALKRRTFDVILGPEVTGIVCHESCGHPQEADRILGREAAQAGESYINRDMIGYRVGSEAVTIIDDPTIPKSYGFYLFDDEGVKARERILINQGVISEFLHNRETAYEFGIISNAAARSVAYNREPIIRMANTYMRPGTFTDQELIEDVEHGIWIKSFMEWNIDDRRFNQRYVGLEAYMIEKGEITHPVRNPVIEITTPGLFSRVDAVGKRIEFEAATCGKGDPSQGIPVWHGGPAIRLRKVNIGGRDTGS
jgi:TldD protein